MGREREETRKDSPVRFPHLHFPFPRRCARASRPLRSTGPALPSEGLRAAALPPEQSRAGPGHRLPDHPAGAGRRWDAGGYGEEEWRGDEAGYFTSY